MHDTNRRMNARGTDWFDRPDIGDGQSPPQRQWFPVKEPTAFASAVPGMDALRYGPINRQHEVKVVVSSGSDWTGRRGRLPQPRLRGDELRLRLVHAARQRLARAEELGRTDVARRVRVRLEAILRRRGIEADRG